MTENRCTGRTLVFTLNTGRLEQSERGEEYSNAAFGTEFQLLSQMKVHILKG